MQLYPMETVPLIWTVLVNVEIQQLWMNVVYVVVSALLMVIVIVMAM